MEDTLSLFDSFQMTEETMQKKEDNLVALRGKQLSQMSANEAEPKNGKKSHNEEGNLFAALDESVGQPESVEEASAAVEEPARVYTKEEVFQDVVDYFHGDQLAASVWVDKYALRNGNGELVEHTPDDMHHRLAREFARIEKKYKNPMGEDLIFSLMQNFKYIVPQGSPMAGIGNNYQVVSLSNCFVIGNGQNADSYGGIMQMDEEQVQLMKRRGGVGHDLHIFLFCKQTSAHPVSDTSDIA